MASKATKAATLGVLAAALAVTLAYSALILPASAQAQANTSTTPNTSTSTGTMTLPPQRGSGMGWGHPDGRQARGALATIDQQPSLTVGQTITVTSTSGEYFVVGNRSENGTASGTLTFTVTGQLARGYTLSISSGSVVVNGTTYTVSSGSAQMGRGAAGLVGQGTTSPTGSFIVSSTAHGSFVGTTATMSLDLTNGSTEYLVFLSGSV